MEISPAALDPFLACLIVGAAILHSSWNTLIKAEGDRLVSFGLLMLLPGLVCLCLVPFVPLPGPAAWAWLLASTFVHVCYYFGLLGAYARGDMAQVYPIARGLGPLLVALASGGLVGEHLDLREFTGIGLICLGLAGLALSNGLRTMPVKAIGFAVFTGTMIAAYTLLDGIGARTAGQPLTYILWLNVLEAPWVFIYAWIRHGPMMVPVVRRIWLRSLAGGVVASGAYAIPVWAMTLGPIAHIAALREISVLFGAVMGALILKEPFGARRIAAAAVLVAGLLLMNLKI